MTELPNGKTATQTAIAKFKPELTTLLAKMDQMPAWPPGDPAVRNLTSGLENIQSSVNAINRGLDTGDVESINAAADAFTESADQLGRAYANFLLLDETYDFACTAPFETSTPPSPSPLPSAVDAATAFTALASDANARFRALGTPQPGTMWFGTPDQEEAISFALLAIEDDVASGLRRISWRPSVQAEAATLIEKVDDVRQKLREDPSGGNLSFVSATELVNQLYAVNDLREKLGLPFRPATDIL